MSLATLCWKKLIRKKQKKISLTFLPVAYRQGLNDILGGETQYKACFDATKSIFVHLPKCAGSSVAKSLYGPKGVGHVPLSWHEFVNSDKFNSYFKFTFTRNPWDRAFSAYNYLKNSQLERDSEWSAIANKYRNFNDFALNELNYGSIFKQIHLVPQYTFMTSLSGEIKMDFIGKVENLDDDYELVASRIIGSQPLEKINVSSGGNYRDAYTQESQKLIASLYSQDIDLFHYQF